MTERGLFHQDYRRFRPRLPRPGRERELQTPGQHRGLEITDSRNSWLRQLATRDLGIYVAEEGSVNLYQQWD